MSVYTHDCDACIFLGNHVDELSCTYDLYYCPDGTLIARHSNEGPDYYSLPVDMVAEKIKSGRTTIEGRGTHPLLVAHDLFIKKNS